MALNCDVLRSGQRFLDSETSAQLPLYSKTLHVFSGATAKKLHETEKSSNDSTTSVTLLILHHSQLRLKEARLRSCTLLRGLCA